jgi:hypothetical protein
VQAAAAGSKFGVRLEGQLLTTDLPSFVTGATIDVNGGAHIPA